MKHLVWLEDAAALDSRIVGFKFSSLARAHQAGLPVPAAAALDTGAWREYVDAGELSPALEQEVLAAAARLGLERGLSVRSSGTQEDLPGRSFAGLYDSFLNVTDGEELLERIADCFDSASSDSVRAYLGEERQGVEMAVILQRMVHPEAAGVAFSANPLAPERREVLIEAVPGLADELVSGHTTPHRVAVGPDGEVRQEDAPEAGVPAPKLTPEQWREIAALARRAEELNAAPQDIEWAVDPDGAAWLLQSRPITTLDRAPAPEAPAGSWTRGIAIDLWADRLTPFLADRMVARSHLYDFSAVGRFIGMPVVQPALITINSYLYVNCASLEQTLAVVPARLRTRDLLELFPPGSNPQAIPGPRLGRLLILVLRTLLVGFRFPRSNPLICDWLSRRGLVRLERRLETIRASEPQSADAALERVRRTCDCLTDLQIANQFPYLYATVFTVALRHLTTSVLGGTHDEFLRLISGEFRNVTSEIEQEFRRLAELFRSDPKLLERLGAEPAPGLDVLGDPLRAELDRFLARYGMRARHRALHYKRWSEAPEEVLGMIRTLALKPREAGRPAADLDPGAGETRPSAAGRAPGRWLAGALRRWAKSYLDLREDLRFALDRVLFDIRRSLLALGRITGIDERVFFLTLAELEDLVGGRLDLGDARRLARAREEAFAEPAEPYPFWVDGRPIDPPSREGEDFKGIGTSPGRVIGRARIVEDPTRAEIRAGDILVARNTDPGWTPILSAVSGVVVEEGGLLNHCSIVARELKIPAVVGVRGATHQIPEGAELLVDGSLGIVRRIDGAAGRSG